MTLSRRRFVEASGLRLSLIVVVLLGSALFAAPREGRAASERAPARGEIAVTVDDLPQNGREYGLDRMRRMTEHLVKAVAKHRVPAVVFVNEAQLFTHPGEVDARIGLLDEWASAGIELGNHSYAHRAFRDVTLAQYEEDVVRGETITKQIAARHGLPYRYFRHPYLDTGPNLETRDAFERFLAGRGYTVAPVTIDASDWMFAAVYADAVERRDKAEMRRVAEAYLKFSETALSYAEAYSQALFGRPIRHVLLLHASELNADHFDELATMFERHGYAFVTLGRALEDEAYRGPDTYARDEGASWLDHWAITRAATTKPTPEPAPPAWVSDAYDKVTASAPERIPGSRN